MVSNFFPFLSSLRFGALADGSVAGKKESWFGSGHRMNVGRFFSLVPSGREEGGRKMVLSRFFRSCRLIFDRLVRLVPSVAPSRWSFLGCYCRCGTVSPRPLHRFVGPLEEVQVRACCSWVQVPVGQWLYGVLL